MTYNELELELTEEQIALKRETHKFAKEVMRPASIELDQLADPEDVIKSPAYWNVMKKGYELGYHSIFIPDTWGGMGLDPLDVHIVLEELGWGAGGMAIGLCVGCFPAFFSSMVPTDKLIDDVILPFCECDDASFIGCWGITEPEHGTDTLSPGTEMFSNPDICCDVKARLDGDEWVISGQKSAWVSNGTVATHCLCFLTIEPSMGMAGGGICVIPTDLPGVRKGKPLDKMGQRDLNQGELYFDNVRIPKDYMMVDQEAYDGILDLTLATANASMGAIFTGVARSAFDLALDYSKKRIQGGKPIFQHQMIKHKLFSMFMKVEAARALSRAAFVYNLNNSPPLTEYSIASKVFCTQTALEVANDAVQIFGGVGLSKEYPIEKIFRDARASLIEDGANDTLMITAAHQF